jgi:hypothetical protein
MILLYHVLKVYQPGVIHVEQVENMAEHLILAELLSGCLLLSDVFFSLFQELS